MPESLFVYSCIYPAGEGPFRAGFESVPGNSPELAQPISGEITALSDHSSSVGRSVHARLPVPVAVAGFWSGLVYRARVLQHCAARSPVQFFWIAWKFPAAEA